MSVNFNVADAARGMDDAELAASIAAMSAEQQRRAAIPPDTRPDPKIKAMLEKRHDDLFGNHTGR